MQFMKTFLENIQAQEQVKLWKHPFKARTQKTYLKKFYMGCYYFYQQYEDYLETLGVIGMNHTLFATKFFYGIISYRCA